MTTKDLLSRNINHFLVFEIEYFKSARYIKVFIMINRDEDVNNKDREIDGATRIRPMESIVTIASTVLMNGAREVTILHAGEHYRLRVTSNNKLILTK